MNKDPAVFDRRELQRLKEICAAVRAPIPPNFVQSSEVFLAELIKWNRTMNLISRGDERRVIRRHLLDSLCLLSVERNLSGKRLLDVGSGAGFPGLVLAIWEPEVEAFLAESRGKRIAFLKAVRRLLHLNNVSVVHARVERLNEVNRVPRPVDIVVSRGVGDVLGLVSSVGDLVSDNGSFVLYKGPGVVDELTKSREYGLVKKLGYEVDVVKPPWQHFTVLVVLRKATSS